MADKNIFVDRGDPSDWDWEETDLTTDATWRDLDCSSIVPVGATHIAFRGYINSSANDYFQIRKNGNSNAYTAQTMTCQRTGAIEFSWIVPCDTSRVVEYLATNTSWTGIKIVVTGWIIPLPYSVLSSLTENTSPAKEDLLYTVADPSGTPVDRRVTVENTMKLAPHWVYRDVSDWDWEVGDLTLDGSYHELDISSIVPANASRVQVHIRVNPSGTAWRNWVVRAKSNDYTRWQFYTTFWFDGRFNPIFPCFNNRTLEYMVENGSVSNFSIVVTGWCVDSINYSTTTTTTTTTTV
jgi:hypothetical protein